MSQSKKLYERATKVMPGGISRNTVYRKPYPLYSAEGKGCQVTTSMGSQDRLFQ